MKLMSMFRKKKPFEDCKDFSKLAECLADACGFNSEPTLTSRFRVVFAPELNTFLVLDTDNNIIPWSEVSLTYGPT